MNDTYSQAFRFRSSSEVVLMPTCYDSKSGRRVIRWKDIQQCFKDAQYVTHNGRAVMFLTDNHLEDLLPQRIAHRPGEVLEVVVTNDNQGGSSSMTSCEGDPIHHSHVRGEHSVTPVSSQERVVQKLPMRNTSPHPSEADDSRHLQENIHQMQEQMQRMEETLVRIQQQTEVKPMSQQTRDVIRELERSIEEYERSVKQYGSVGNMIEQQMKASREKAQQSQQQQVQQQLNGPLEKPSSIDQQAHHQSNHQQSYEHLLLQYEQLQHQFEQLQQREYLSPQAFDKFVHAQHRVQVVLTKASPELPIPRLFIILPEPTAVVDRQGRPCSLEFRLYFLCECGANTMARDDNKPHEVHLANHPGYDIEKQDEFIEKYGSYLLTMMYMVKYGAVAGGLVVRPLLGLNRETEDGEDQERLQFIKKNIGRLVNDTTTYLESTTNTLAQMDLGSSELAQLRSYLKFMDDDRPIGDLLATSTQKGHCAWICCNHLLEYYEPAFQRLMYILFTTGGVCHDNKVELKITSETTKKQLYSAIGNVRGIQNVGNWQSLKQVGLDMNDHSSAMRSTSEMINSLNGLESLSLDFGRLSMVANGISQGVVSDVALEVPRLCELTLDDFEFIHQCHPILLKILHASENMDEARLVDILQYSTRLRTLHIGCAGERFFILVNSILSTRDKILQSGGHVALRSLELKGEGLVPLKRPKPCGYHQHICAVTISFSEEPHSFDMETQVSFDEIYLSPNDSAACDFIQQYGWSIKFLGAPSSFSDHHAELLDQVTRERGSMIERVNITPDSLTKTGLDALHRAIERSKNFHTVRLYLNMLPRDGWVMKALLLFGRYKGHLTHLCLNGDGVVEQWMTHIEPAFPTKDEFPILETLCAANAGDAPWNSVLQFFLRKTFNSRVQDMLRRMRP